MHEPFGQLYRAGLLTPALHGLLEKDPANRMTAEEAERHLHNIVNGITAEPDGPLHPRPPALGHHDPGRRQPVAAAGKTRRSWPFTAVVTAVLAAGPTAGTIAYVTASDHPPNPADTIPAQVPAKNKKASTTPLSGIGGRRGTGGCKQSRQA